MENERAHKLRCCVLATWLQTNLPVASTMAVSLPWPLWPFLIEAGPADRCTVDSRFDAFSAGFAEIATKPIKELLSLQRK